MRTARDEILARVRAATGSAAAVPAERGYRRTGERPRHELVELFCERVHDYRAQVQRVDAGRLTELIALVALRHEAQRLVIPPGLPEGWRPEGLELIADTTRLTPHELDRSDGVITGCTVAIAETGTIVLSADAHEGRRQLSLVPDLHICVVRESQIVGGVPEAIGRLGEIVRTARRPLTMISGPSATSDIELQRVEGVHGPRRLVVLMVGNEGPGVT